MRKGGPAGEERWGAPGWGRVAAGGQSLEDCQNKPGPILFQAQRALCQGHAQPLRNQGGPFPDRPGCGLQADEPQWAEPLDFW